MKIFENTRLVSIMLFLISFFFYALTINQYVTFTDNGELAASSILLGISHPTGYPLFTILGYIWSLIPLPFSKIVQMNLLSAMYVSLSSVVLFFVLQLLLSKFSYIKVLIENKKNKKVKNEVEIKNLNLQLPQINLISFISSLTYFSALTIWQQANSYEVYSLQLLLFSLFLYFALKIYFNLHSDTKKLWYILAFIWGLMLTNHLIAVWIAPALFWLYFINSDYKFSIEKHKLPQLAILALFVLIPLSIYFYLPIRSAMLPDVNWGWVHRSFDKFLYHLSGKQYQVWMFSDNSVAGKNLGNFFGLIPYQFGFVGIIFIIIGLWVSFKNRIVAIFLTLIIVFTILYSMNYSIFDIENYFVTPFLVFVLFMSVGIAFFVKKYPKILPYLLIIPLLNLVFNIPETNRSNDYAVQEYCKNLLDNIEKDAIVISAQWDYFVGPFLYLQKIEKQRTDIVIFEKELLRRTWYPLQFRKENPEIYEKSRSEFQSYEAILELFESEQPYNPNEIQAKYLNLHKSIIEKNWNERTIYVTIDSYLTDPEFYNQFDIVPFGFAMKILPKNSPVQDLSTVKLDLSVLSSIKKRYNNVLNKGIIEIIQSQIKNMIIYSKNTGQTEIAIFWENELKKFGA